MLFMRISVALELLIKTAYPLSMVTRELKSELREAAAEYPVVTILGATAVGENYPRPDGLPR